MKEEQSLSPLKSFKLSLLKVHFVIYLLRRYCLRLHKTDVTSGIKNVISLTIQLPKFKLYIKDFKMKTTLYKSFKIVDNYLTLNGTAIYKFSSDELTQQVVSAHAETIKKQIKNSSMIKTAITEIISFEINNISPTYTGITILYGSNDRCFKAQLYIDTHNGFILNF